MVFQSLSSGNLFFFLKITANVASNGRIKWNRSVAGIGRRHSPAGSHQWIYIYSLLGLLWCVTVNKHTISRRRLPKKNNSRKTKKNLIIRGNGEEDFGTRWLPSGRLGLRQHVARRFRLRRQVGVAPPTSCFFILFIFACLFTLWPFFCALNFVGLTISLFYRQNSNPSRQQMRENFQWFLSWLSFLFPSNKYAIDFGILK